MSVFNGEKFLHQAIESVFRQTFDNFEFVVIDDCSSDLSSHILARYAEKDSRVRLFFNSKNIGLANSLNRGLKLSSGEYVARMDADDVCHPERFSKQIKFLDMNRDVAILGTNVTRIDSNGLPTYEQPLPYPTDPGFIKWALYFRNCLQHPTVTFRRDAVIGVGGYDSSLSVAQDYDLWLRASFSLKLSNLSERLVEYRWHNKNVSETMKMLQWQTTVRVSHNALCRLLGKDFPIEYIRVFVGKPPFPLYVNIHFACTLMKDLWKMMLQDSTLDNRAKARITKDFRRRLFYLFFASYNRPSIAFKISSIYLHSLFSH